MGKDDPSIPLNSDATERGRLRRLIQPYAGNPDIFSSERSFAPPIGGNIARDGKPRGYYIDFSLKTDEPSWPPSWLRPRDKQLHVATIQWGLGAYERYVSGEGEAWLAAAVDAGDYLISIQQNGGVRDGGWIHWMPMYHTYYLPAPWLSGITQGEAASLLTRLHGTVGEERFADSARRALDPLRIPVDEGGLYAQLEEGDFYEEYPSRPASYVLNGDIFALWGFRDVGIGLGDRGVEAEYERGVDALAAQIHRYDIGSWSRYDLYPHPLPNIASSAYHRLHITQLEVLESTSPRPELSRARETFESYRTSRAKRNQSFARKVAFRVFVPRTRALAHRLPWNKRVRKRKGGEEPRPLALCYHAVSEDWQSLLSVKPAQLEEQLSFLAERGYASATFSEIVLGGKGGKRVAITFDDGYASTAELALPILQKLGMRGTVFVPTDFMGTEGPMSWPGIERWAKGEAADDLRPLSWEQIEMLAEAGWEIGSHSTRHDRLTTLTDVQLGAELRRSREAIEARLGRPCLSIAYPYGDADERVIRAASEAGFVTAATVPSRHHEGRAMSWPRTGVYQPDSQRVFKMKVSPGSRRLRRTPVWEWLAIPTRFLLGRSTVERS
jgi:peptidoglycan/xylan/chitin deacetylase (PgdA/CDA1 family)